jgi:hypothetical protein
MRAFPYLVIALIVLLSLAACTEPLTLSQSSDRITLRWWSDELADAQAAGTAGAYCTQMGKAMQLSSIGRDGSASIGHYRCV